MARKTFKITFMATPPAESRWAEEVAADDVGHIHDGDIAWLNFHDSSGEVLRVRSGSVERVERVG